MISGNCALPLVCTSLGFVAVDDDIELAGLRMDEQAVNRRARREKRVIANDPHAVSHAFLDVIKTAQPSAQIDACVLEDLHDLRLNAADKGLVDDLIGIHPG